MKVDIKIQSFSDIITNSSSEVFCTITSEHMLDEIQSMLRPLFGHDSEMEPTMHTYDEGIEISLPYGVYGLTDFYKEGLKAILDKYFGGHYEIKFEDTEY